MKVGFCFDGWPLIENEIVSACLLLLGMRSLNNRAQCFA